jgi:hypothetical protein
MRKKRVLIAFPDAWDRKQFDACAASWQDRYELVYATPTSEACTFEFDVIGYVEQMVAQHRGRIDGVFSSSDYPGVIVAAAIATRLGLPGPRPEAVLRAMHKYYSRLAQRAAVPEHTPRFDLIDPRDPRAGRELEYPVFVKPVKGAFSVHSRKISSAEELRAFLDRPVIREFTDEYMAMFNRLMREYAGLDIDGRYFLAESFLHGVQATVEGLVVGGRVEICGIVDSIMHLGIGSFARFDYPSSLNPEIQRDIEEVTRRAIGGLDLDHCLFNMEVIYDPADDAIRIIEVNPRICGQFGDLYQKVDGMSSYVLGLAVATGEAPARSQRRGRYACAASFPLRLFRPVEVLAAPDAARIEAASALYPETLAWCECAAGTRLADFDTWEDGHSVRYGIVNVGAGSRRELRERLASINAALGFEFREIQRACTESPVVG